MEYLSRRLLATFILASATACAWAEFKTTADDQQTIWLTVYNGGRALVKDTRRFTLSEPEQHIALMDVAQKIMPQTVAIEGLDVLEQNYDFDLLSPQSLINKNIGRSVRIARRSTVNGETLEWRDGVILSTEGGVIIKMSDGSLELLDKLSSYHLVFGEIPDSLRVTPTLSLRLQHAVQGEQDILLTYLTTGLSWQSDYVLQIGKDETTATLDSWITLNNQSGIAYRNVQLQLLAGDINMQSAPRPQMLMDSMRMKAAASPVVREQALQGYHLYSVGHKTSIKNRQSKQIKLFSAHNIPVHKQLKDSGYINAGNIEPIKSKPDQFLIFANNKPALGMALPKGVVRVYGQDDSAQQQFLGEDRIDHTAQNETLKINMGKSFDITVERQTIEVRQLSKKQRRFKRRISINNGGESTQALALTEIMPSRSWSIESSTKRYQKNSPSSAVFNLSLPALKKTIIDYEVVVQYP